MVEDIANIQAMLRTVSNPLPYGIALVTNDYGKVSYSDRTEGLQGIIYYSLPSNPKKHFVASSVVG